MWQQQGGSGASVGIRVRPVVAPPFPTRATPPPLFTRPHYHQDMRVKLSAQVVHQDWF